MEFRTECPAMGTLWEEAALQPFLRTVSDRVAYKRYAKPTKTEIKAINLDLPLMDGRAFGAEYASSTGIELETELDPFVFDLQDDETANAPLSQVAASQHLPMETTATSASLALKARHAAQSEQNVRYTELSEVPEERFGLLTFASIAKLAAGLLYNDLHLLLHGRGSPQTKASILDWIFAEKWGYRWYANGYDTLPMKHIPFTAQFCCEVEGIDIHELRAAISGLVELAVKRDAEESDVNAETINHTQPIVMSRSTFEEHRVQ